MRYDKPKADEITMRDWFAGMALTGWMASFPPDVVPDHDMIAEFAYAQADAMLRAREAGHD